MTYSLFELAKEKAGDMLVSAPEQKESLVMFIMMMSLTLHNYSSYIIIHIFKSGNGKGEEDKERDFD